MVRREEIQREVGQGNLKQAADLAHAVKGVSGVLGAQPLLKAARRLEAVLKQGDVEPGPCLQEFKDELEATLEYLRAG